MHYRCEECNGMMEYKGKTKKGKRYMCRNCGCTGYMENMKEGSTESGIDPGAFGL
jgi:hypothetical protein